MKRKTKGLLFIILAIAIIFVNACDKSPTESDNGNDDNIKIIEISDNLNYADDHAVWFSPSTGEIVVFDGNGDEPPEEKYIYWIAPSDPEFETWLYGNNQDTFGLKLIGIGNEFFVSSITTEDGGFDPILVNPEDPNAVEQIPEANSVYFVRAENSDCLIQFIEWDYENDYLKFRWLEL